MDYKKKNKDKKALNYLHSINKQSQKLYQDVLQFIPLNLQNNIISISYQHGILSLNLSSQLAINQLRFLLPSLQQQLQQSPNFASLKKISLIIATIATNSQQSIYNKPQIERKFSPQSADELLEFSKSIDYPDLKQSLQRLSQTLKENSTIIEKNK